MNLTEVSRTFFDCLNNLHPRCRKTSRHPVRIPFLRRPIGDELIFPDFARETKNWNALNLNPVNVGPGRAIT